MKQYNERDFVGEIEAQRPNTVRYSSGYRMIHSCQVCKKTIKANKKYLIVVITEPKRFTVCSEKCATFCLFQHLGEQYA